MQSLSEMMRDKQQVADIVNDMTIGHAEASRQIKAACGEDKGREAVRAARVAAGWQRHVEQPVHVQTDAPEAGTGKVTVTHDGGEFENVVLTEPIVDGGFNRVFELFKLDPALYEIVGETVRMSTWQQSKRLENGNRDITQLYSYSCRFRRLGAAPVSEDEFEIRRKRVLKWKPGTRRTLGSGLGEPSTLVVNWADWQLGKSEGGGTVETEQRVLDSFERTTERFKELRKIGRNVEGIAIVNMGDPIEGCMGNYASQTFTVELNLRRQLLLALDLFEIGILSLSSLAEKVNAIGVLCNHGEWTRVDGKAATGDSDNASGFLMDTVQRVIRSRGDMDHIKWTIPHDEMIVMEELSGVQNAFTHGHKITGGTLKAEEQWLASQSIHLLRTHGAEPRLWTTAHKHHAFLIDFGPWHRIQCSALDGGSKWYLDASGLWSTPGTTTYLVGKHDVRGFSDYAVV